MDKDLFEGKSIEASRVYIPNLDLYVFGQTRDDESRLINSFFMAAGQDQVSVVGVILSKEADSLMLRTDFGTLEVLTNSLANKVDKRTGIFALNVGDSVL